MNIQIGTRVSFRRYFNREIGSITIIGRVVECFPGNMFLISWNNNPDDDFFCSSNGFVVERDLPEEEE